MSKCCKKCFVSKSVSKSVLHNSYVITVSKKCPSWALSKLGPNLTHVQDTSCIDIWKDLGELDLTGAWCNSCTFHMEIVYVLCIVSTWLAQVFYYPV